MKDKRVGLDEHNSKSTRNVNGIKIEITKIQYLLPRNDIGGMGDIKCVRQTEY